MPFGLDGDELTAVTELVEHARGSGWSVLDDGDDDPR